MSLLIENLAEKYYKCDLCRKELWGYRLYLRHRRGHIPPYKQRCPSCGNSFESRLIFALRFMWKNGLDFYPGSTYFPEFDCSAESLLKMCGRCILEFLSNCEIKQVRERASTILMIRDDLENGDYVAKITGHSRSWVTDVTQAFDKHGLLSFKPKKGRPSNRSKEKKTYSLEEVEAISDSSLDVLFGTRSPSEVGSPRRLVNDPLLRAIFKIWHRIELRG